MEMTIKQLANQLGVSKTTISKAISALGLQGELKRSGNKYLLSDTQIECVKTQIENQKSQTASEKSQTTNQNALLEVLELLNKQLSIKDDQIREYQDQIRLLQEQIISKDKQIEQITAAMENTTAALTASQALHAGTIQRQLTEQINSKENTAPETQEQPTQKQGFFSKFFGKKNN
ncbi:MAG: HTH domain-containing protein [Ruminococcus bromii]|nr:HTH domain-containing protein [Ruminococcus bromii]